MEQLIIHLEHLHPVRLFGVDLEFLKQIQGIFPKMRIVNRGHEIIVQGNNEELNLFSERFGHLMTYFERFGKLNAEAVLALMQEGDSRPLEDQPLEQEVVVYSNDGAAIRPRSQNQLKLVKSIQNHDLTFAVGPAGTGKTYLAVAMAVKALKEKQVKKIILTRPAVEAGENLGFLPGDLNEKLSPYLQPLFDALRDMIPAEKLKHYTETGIVQIAPLAYMRGRTLDHAFVILDEAQNATTNQMKMFLTRMGKSATFVVNGDVTQIDLPARQKSGLPQAIRLLKGIKNIGFIEFAEKDVVRHPLVKKILNAYASHESES
ncbi:MAG: PhoH family protein [Bacteroidetes bacterium]|nr:PhoH family protein [Bacteroidota bacterium]